MQTVGLWVQAPGRVSRILLGGLLVLLLVVDTDAMSRAWYDVKVRASIEPAPVNSRVTVIDIDDRSLAAVGRWPWSRTELTALLRLLAQHDPHLIAVDLLFPESGGPQDQDLVDLLHDPRFLIAVALDFETEQRSGRLPPNETEQPDDVSTTQLFGEARGWVGLFPELTEQVTSSQVGHVNIIDDVDGVVRSLPGRISAGETILTSFPDLIVGRVSGDLERSIPKRTQHLIPYVFDPRVVTSVSALDVLNGSVPAELLTAQILLVGSSASGLSDRVITPMGYAIPGVALQAMAVDAWLSGHYFDDRQHWSMVALLLGIFIGGCVLWWMPVMTDLRWPLALIGLAFLTLCLNWLELRWNQRHWDPTGLIAVCVGSAIVLIYQSYALQRVAAAKIRNMFQSYVPNEVLETLLTGDVDRFHRGERARVTVLFADIVGFTKLAEEAAPEELTQTVRSVFNLLTGLILEHGGTVDKYMGDAVMAFWGAPLPDAQQETRAVACAIAMQSAIQDLPQGLALGIGINTGDATVGNMGSDFRHAYSVLGDSVNIAARLEGQTRHMEASILMGQATASACEQPTRSLGTISLKGKQRCIEVFCL